jgi:hypothetical protein
VKKKLYKLEGHTWLYPGHAGWVFVSLPPKETKSINEDFKEFKKGWGSLPVEVKIGKTKFKTSIFPDKKNGVYLLPIKKVVRKIEGIIPQDKIKYQINIMV